MLDKHDELEYFLKPGTQKRTEAICDGNVKGLCEGVIVQLERKGFDIWTGPLARQSMRSWFCLRSQLGLRIHIQTPKTSGMLSVSNPGGMLTIFIQLPLSG